MFSGVKSTEVVITGVGLVTPLGSSIEGFYAALRTGTSALVRDPSLSKWLMPGGGDQAAELAENAPCLGRVGDFGAQAAIEAGRRRRMPRLGQFCVVAAQQALGCVLPAGGAAKGPPPSPVLSHYGNERVGVVLGTGLGALDTTLEFTVQYIEGGLGAASPALFPYTVMNTASALVAMELGLLGPNLTINHRDLSLSEAVGSAADLIACGHLDAVLAGGCDELGLWLLHAYKRLGMLPKDGNMLPYDLHRSGFCPGEGAVLLLLERADAAAARGAKVLARLSGIGRHGDNRPRVGWLRPLENPEAAAAGAATAISGSLEQAGLLPADVDFIAGSGNGSALDLIETLALRRALGKDAERVAISSVLGQTGEWMTSAGIRLLAGLYALHEQALPGTRCETPDPATALPGLCLAPKKAASRVKNVLVPTLSQGGGNLALLLSQP